MQHNIEHLPESKKDELKRIVSVIREMCDDVAMIILFGSYARGDYKVEADLKPGRRSGHVSDYDILVVPEYKTTAADVSLWNEITDALLALKFSAHPRIIAHDIRDVNIKLGKGQYFFYDIRKEGCMLFDSGKFELAGEQKQAAEEKQRTAREYFAYWFRSAKGFYKQYEHAVNDNDLNIAAFDLHQAAEHSFKTVLLVFTNYFPKEHWLCLLVPMAAGEDCSFAKVFPRETEEEKDRFNLLDEAYIGGRYDPEYSISKVDLGILAVHVKKLIELTEKVCKQKIESFIPL